MKILIINFEYPPLGGGGGVATRDAAEALARRHDVHVLTMRHGDLPARESSNGVTIHRVSVIGRHSLPTASIVSMMSFVPMSLLRGGKLCRTQHFDVINAQFVLPSGLVAAPLSRLFSIPLVLSFIGGDIYDPTKGVSPHRHGLLRWLVRLIARQATTCTAISADIKRRARELHRVTNEIIVSPLGLRPPSAIPAATRADFNLPEHVPLFVSIGRLIPRKGYEYLIEAWRDIPTAHLVIIGTGPLEQKLHRLIREYDISGRVHVLGFVDEQRKQQVLRLAQCYISAAEHEGFGIVFLEAMEAGLPVIATDNGGQTDFLTEGETAILVPPRDSRQLTAAIIWLLRDSRLRENMARNNKQKVKEYYLDKTVKIFEDVLIKASHAHRN